MSDMIQLEALSPEALGEVIRARADEFDKSAMRAVEHAWHAGRALLAAKKLVPHGQWGQWLKDNFGDRSQQTASNWMRLASNYQSTGNLESVKHGLLMLDDTPEKQAKKAEREAKKLEAPPKPLAPATPAPPMAVGTIRHESPPAPQPERPAWLADPDELERPESDDLPQLPRTNTHHTAENRRQPDARETDRIGIVPPDDPRTYHDGGWYEWNEDLGRMVAVTVDQILWRAKAIGEARGLILAVSGAPTPDSCDTKNVVDRERDTTAVVQAKPGKVPTVAQLTEMLVQRSAPGNWPLNAVEMVGRWAGYKQSLTGKAKIRSLEQWSVALTRIENVVAAQGWPAVADMIEKAIANGWQGWEHTADNGRKSAPVAPHRTYTRLSKPEIKYDELPE